MNSEHEPDELSADARSLLDAYRREDDLPVSVEQRVRDDLFAPRRRMPAYMVFAFAAAATTILVFGLAYLRRSATQEASSSVNAASHHGDQGDTTRGASRRGGTSSHVVQEPAPPPPPEATGGPTVQRPAEVDLPPPASSPRVPVPSPTSPAKAGIEPARPADRDEGESAAGQLAREQAALDVVRQALASRQIDRAQAAIERFRSHFSHPQLDEEAAALETIVRCQRDPDGAGARLENFLSQHVGSLFLTQVRLACTPR